MGKDVTATAARIPVKGEPIVRSSTYMIGDSGASMLFVFKCSDPRMLLLVADD